MNPIKLNLSALALAALAVLPAARTASAQSADFCKFSDLEAELIAEYQADQLASQLARQAGDLGPATEKLKASLPAILFNAAREAKTIQDKTTVEQTVSAFEQTATWDGINKAAPLQYYFGDEMAQEFCAPPINLATDVSLRPCSRLDYTTGAVTFQLNPVGGHSPVIQLGGMPLDKLSGDAARRAAVKRALKDIQAAKTAAELCQKKADGTQLSQVTYEDGQIKRAGFAVTALPARHITEPSITAPEIPLE